MVFIVKTASKLIDINLKVVIHVEMPKAAP